MQVNLTRTVESFKNRFLRITRQRLCNSRQDLLMHVCNVAFFLLVFFVYKALSKLEF